MATDSYGSKKMVILFNNSDLHMVELKQVLWTALEAAESAVARRRWSCVGGGGWRVRREASSLNWWSVHRAKEVAGALAENSRKRAPYNGTDRIEPHQRGDRRYRQLAEQRRVDDEKVKVTKRGDCVNNRMFDIFHILNNWIISQNKLLIESNRVSAKHAYSESS